jgi:hypothetical protein
MKEMFKGVFGTFGDFVGSLSKGLQIFASTEEQ